MARWLFAALLTALAWETSHPVSLGGHENAVIAETGEVASFEWYPEVMKNKSHAVAFCESLGSTVPTVEELRYFYKSLTFPGGFIFYLSNTLEATNSPNEDKGDRMCVTVKFGPGNPVSSLKM